LGHGLLNTGDRQKDQRDKEKEGDFIDDHRSLFNILLFLSKHRHQYF
jgi:hypothetical protein